MAFPVGRKVYTINLSSSFNRQSYFYCCCGCWSGGGTDGRFFSRSPQISSPLKFPTSFMKSPSARQPSTNSSLVRYPSRFWSRLRMMYLVMAISSWFMANSVGSSGSGVRGCSSAGSLLGVRQRLKRNDGHKIHVTKLKL